MKNNRIFKALSMVLVFLILLNSSFGVSSAEIDVNIESAVLVDTDFSDWNLQEQSVLAAGTNAKIDYVYDELLERNVIAASLPKGLNADNSIYVPKYLEKGKEYTVYIAYKITAWSCISYNGSSVYDGKKPLDSYAWTDKTYSFTPTNDNCYFRIGTNQDDYTIYIAELRLFETAHVEVGTSEKGSAAVSSTINAIGDKVTFTATPYSGYKFENWVDTDGNIISNKATFEYEVKGDVTLTPVFSDDKFTLKYYYEDFEDGKLFEGGNTSSSSFLIVSSPDGSSKYSFKHEQSSNNQHYYIKSPALSVGYTYTVSFKCFSSKENKWFRFDVYDSSNTLTANQGRTAKADKWTTYTYNITPTEDGWYVGFLMANEIYIDDFEIINESFPNAKDEEQAKFIEGFETSNNACKAFYGALSKDKESGTTTNLLKTKWSVVSGKRDELINRVTDGLQMFAFTDAEGKMANSNHYGYIFENFGVTAYKLNDMLLKAVDEETVFPENGLILSADGACEDYVGLAYTAPKSGLISFDKEAFSNIALVKNINDIETAHSILKEQSVNVKIYKNNTAVWTSECGLNSENTMVSLPVSLKIKVEKGDRISIVFECNKTAFTVVLDSVFLYVEADMGDANADGYIDIRDLVSIKKNLSLHNEYLFSADTNYDDKNDSYDMILFRKHLLGVVENFPIGGTVPQAVTLSLYDETSYGIAWNTNGEPGEPVVCISKGNKFDSENYKEIEAVYSKGSTYVKLGDIKTDYYILKAVIKNLVVGETYTYHCYDKKYGSRSEDFTFTVKSRDASSFKFIHVSDSQTTSSAYLDPDGDGEKSGWAYRNTWTAIEKTNINADFVLHTGDMVEWSKYESYWRNMLNFNSKYFTSIPIMPLSGNHESTYRNGDYETIKHFNLNLPEQNTARGVYYAFDYGNAKFIMLDTNDLSNNKIKTEQYNWLVETLKNNNQKWTIVSMHNPMYSIGQWGANPSKNTISLALRSQLSDLFAEYGVDLVLQGHDHTYSKTYPIGLGGAINTNLTYETVSGVQCCTNANGVIYVVNGASGNQARPLVNADKNIFELYSDSKESSWAEIEVTENTLIVKVYYCNKGPKTPVIWEQYGIKK